MVSGTQRASLYRTIKRLYKAGLVAVRHTERDENYPERTVFELTDEGRRTLREWLLAMLGTPRNEFPEFPAALSFVMLLQPEEALPALSFVLLLQPEEALPALERRAASLRQSLDALEAALGGQYGPLPRLFLLETEYLRAVTTAELGWVEGIVADLRSGTLTWSEEELLALARSYQSYQQVMADTQPPP